MQKILLSLGSNLGNRLENLNKATVILEVFFDQKAISSSVYKSKSWGFEAENDFYNSCLLFSPKKSINPLELLEECKKIEREMGRVKSGNMEYESRVIDVDILFMGDLVLETEELTIPHKKISKRNFVLYPLAEIAPNLFHIIEKMSVLELKKISNDKGIPKKIN